MLRECESDAKHHKHTGDEQPWTVVDAVAQLKGDDAEQEGGNRLRLMLDKAYGDDRS